MNGAISRLIRRTADIKEQEVAAVIWSAAYFFFVLSAYYVLRPIRDAAGVAGGVKNLPWLFTGTLVGMLLIHPVFAALVCRFPRKRFVPLAYRFFILHLVIFFLLYKFVEPSKSVWIGRIFFIWASIFNLFVVSVFWSFMTDVFRPGQSKRLFGIVAVGGSIGAMTGSLITSALADRLGSLNLLLVSAVLLEVACYASRILERHESALALAAEEPDPATEPGTPANNSEDPIGGRLLDGIKSVFASPYLLGISGLMLFYTISNTFLYIQQADIVSHSLGKDSAAQTQLFAQRDLAANTLTLLTQLFLTGRIVRWFGVGIALAFLPLLSAVGFALLGSWPVLGMAIAFDVVRRGANYAIQQPARGTLYTVLSRSDRYKAKNFNDTFVYRAGDQIGAWSYLGIAALGLSISGLSWTMVPLSILWLALALWIGRKYLQLHRASIAGREPGPAER